MTATKYQYSISNDFPNQAVDTDRLEQEIRDSVIIIALDYVNTSGDDCDIWFKDALSAGDKTILDGIVASHSGLPLTPDPTEVIIQEEYGVKRTGGNFGSRSHNFDISSGVPGALTEHDFSFPIPIAIFSAQLIGKEILEGDEIEFQIAPDTPIGALVADVAVDAEVITVTQSAYDNLKVGFTVCLDDQTNHNNLGMVVEKQVNNQIKVEKKTTNAFAASTPTYVLLTVKMIPHGHLPSCSRLVLGESKIGGTYINANTTLRIMYRNSDGQAKKFDFWLEYMY
ncbi:MAG: hypothetical protein ACTSW7_01170 [Candidatus Thorarchaeota archaeon]|nr:hypothetical protein [Thermoplasmatales archaeon]